MTTQERVISRLSDPDSAHLRKGVELAVDYVLAQKVNLLVDPDEAVELIVDLIAGDNVTRLTERHINPGRERMRAHFRSTGETVNELTPEGTLERVETILRNGDYPRAGWASGAIKKEHVKTLLSPVIQEVLLAFTRKLPIPGGSGDSSSSSKKRRGFGLGSSIMDIGKGVLGDLQGRFQAIAKDFSSQAIADAKVAALTQLASDEGRQTLREMRDSLVEQFMTSKVIDLLDDTERLPIENLLNLLPDIANHNRVRDEFKSFVRGEVEALIAKEGDRPIQELLEENGLLLKVRALIIEQAARQASELFATDSAKKWIADLLGK